MADWVYIAAGFGATAVAIGGYVTRVERRISRLRTSRDQLGGGR